MHGKTLTSGDERKVKLLAICGRLGDPLASHFDKNTFAVYREQSYLHAVFSEMKRLGGWEGDNPFSGIRQFQEGGFSL